MGRAHSEGAPKPILHRDTGARKTMRVDASCAVTAKEGSLGRTRVTSKVVTGRYIRRNHKGAM